MTDERCERLKDAIGTTVGEDGRLRADMMKNANGGDANRDEK